VPSMSTTRIAILLVLSLAVRAAGQSVPEKHGSTVGEPREMGTVCVLPNPAEPPARFSPGGNYNPATLTVRIDKGQEVPWPHKQLVRIENVSLNGRHLIVLKSDGERIQSVWFRFSDYKEVILCLYFDGYQGVQLGDKRTALWCKCK
jgi:hypothetical protein